MNMFAVSLKRLGARRLNLHAIYCGCYVILIVNCLIVNSLTI